MKTPALTLLLAALVALPACGGAEAPDAGAAAFLADLRGTWSTCRPGLYGDPIQQVFGFSETSYAETDYLFGQAGCAGDIFAAGSLAGAIAVGPPRTVAFGDAGGTVTARAVDLTSGGRTSHTVAFLDTSTTPHRLYLGRYDAAHDGGAASARPVALEASVAYLRQ